MSTIPATPAETRVAAPAAESTRLRLYLTRGLLAIAWAIVFGAVDNRLSVGVAVLLVAYPLIDVIASLLDRTGLAEASTRRVQLLNAMTGVLAAVALGIAATGTVGDVADVFGVWAILAGTAQVLVAIWTRTRSSGHQWPLLIAGGLSVLVGVYYITTDPHLKNFAIYAAGGGVWFVIQAGILAHRRRARPV